MIAQLPLGIRLKDTDTFANFFPAGNEQLLNALREGNEPYLYFWGGEGAGKTHLLQALCHRAAEAGGRPAYLPLTESALAPSVLEGLEQFELICLDDIQAVVGQREWEVSLFHLYNRAQEMGARLVVSGHAAPASLPFCLPDLASRMAWGPVYQLRPLDDKSKQKALQRRAEERGFSLSDEVADYLLKRCPRDMKSLFETLDKLDRASLAAKRRLTIPFVRQFL